MNIHIVLSRDVQSYLGLKANELKDVSKIPGNVHWYGVWRMDLWPNDLAALPERTDHRPLILVNRATRYVLLEMDSVVGLECFKGNVEGYLQWPLHVGSFPTESYGSMKVHFYRGAERSLAASMKDMRERAECRGGERGNWQIHDHERVLAETQDWLNEVPLQVNGSRSAKEVIREMILEDPPKFFPSKYDQGSRSESGKVIPFPGGSGEEKEGGLLGNVGEKPVWTDRQGQFLAFIHAYTLVNGQAPAEVDMKRFFEISAPSVHAMVKSLDESGFITRVRGQGRSISLVVSSELLPVLRSSEEQ